VSEKTAIAWTDATWNPVTGCSHVSEGCRNCYAEALSLRFGRSKLPWTAPNAAENVKLHPERLKQPLRWKKPRRIFVNSMSDLFHEQVPDDFLVSVFMVMRGAWGPDGDLLPVEQRPRHIYQILTKRPERMRDFMRARYPEGYGLPNVWLGVSVEDQRSADERIPLLLQTPAAVRFLSCEPLLGPVDLTALTVLEPEPPNGPGAWLNALTGHVAGPDDMLGAQIAWVIVGGESGPHFRPMDLAWAASLRDQCQAAGVPFFFKQASGRLPGKGADALGQEHHEFPQALAVAR
jgi:protein gp37